MKIILDLPEWADDQRITILAGMEMIAQKAPWETKWHVKDARCNNCGECCMMLNPTDIKYAVDEEGKCEHLYREIDGRWLCGATYDKPYRCLMDPHPGNAPNCAITYTEK